MRTKVNEAASPKKRVLVFSDEYPPAGGGAGIVASQLVDDLVRMGTDVHLLTGDEPPQPASGVNEHYRVQRRRLVWPLAYSVVIKRLDLPSFDLIVLNDFVAAYIAGLLFPTQELAKTVVVIHGEDARYVYRRRTLKHYIFWYQQAYTRLLRKCRSTVAVSNYARETFCRHLPPGLSPKVEFCHAGLALVNLPRPAPVRKEALGLPGNSRLLFSASRLVREKGLLNQLSLFDDAVQSGANYYWFIAGDGPLRSTLMQGIANRGLEGRVRLLGRLPRSELASYFMAADVFWLLSYATYETMGLVYLEAAFYGTPSIGLRNFGVVESISEGESGLFYNGGLIAPLIEDAISRISIDGCRSHAMRFSSKNFASYLLGLSK